MGWKVKSMYHVPDNRSTSKMLEMSQSGRLNRLTPRERGMVDKRFGLDGLPPRTFEAIAADSELSRERVRQIIVHALSRIGVDPWE